MRKLLANLVLLASLSIPGTVFALNKSDIGPVLTPTTSADNPLCRDALRIARNHYFSTNTYDNNIPDIPANIGSQPILDARVKHYDNYDIVSANQAYFKEIPRKQITPDERGSIFWQRNPGSGHRLVLVEDDFGWRGDVSYFYLLPNALSLADFASSLDLRQSLPIPAVLKMLWAPPQILHHINSGQTWIYHQNSVLTGRDGSLALHCKTVLPNDIYVRPSDISSLIALLDQTLGDGRQDGTLQQTARLRGSADRFWTLIHTRPWAALTASPPNSSNQIETGLNNWSRQSLRHREIRDQIRIQIPRATSALDAYLINTFGYSPEKTGKMASTLIDLGVRHNFVFAREP